MLFENDNLEITSEVEENDLLTLDATNAEVDATQEYQTENTSEPVLVHEELSPTKKTPLFVNISKGRHHQTCELLKMREHKCGLHYHDHVEVFYLHSGRQKIHIDGKEVFLEAGQLVFADSFEIHAYYHSPGAVSSVLLIPQKYLDDYNNYKADRSLKNHVITDTDLAAQCASFMSRILSERNGLVKRGYINTLLGLVTEELQFVVIPDKEKKNTLFATAVVDYIAHHITENITRETLAGLFFYSTTHFTRKFHAIFGCHLSEYITNARIVKFLELHKQNPKTPLYMLAQNAGFKNPNTFYRRFKEIMGKTPQEYFQTYE